MSIFGERIHRGPDTAGDYAKKDYVDEQLALRVLKTGDTMTGDLTMAQVLIRGLPLTQPMGTITNSDEAISSYHVIELINRAFRADRNARKPLITVYAEEYGSLTKENMSGPAGTVWQAGAANGDMLWRSRADSSI